MSETQRFQTTTSHRIGVREIPPLGKGGMASLATRHDSPFREMASHSISNGRGPFGGGNS
jgi:hypothetical protein